MTINTYVRGTVVVLTGAFLAPSTFSGLTPSPLVCRVTDPTGEETDITTGFGNPAPGIYTAEIEAQIVGTWTYRWRATGAVTGACEGSFVVVPTAYSLD
jgi:hypothetical protein